VVTLRYAPNAEIEMDTEKEIEKLKEELTKIKHFLGLRY